ncbi:MAG: hypothetical protein COA49_06025 [Bacteroidetes bacterium]|nr:MAG: hypothetical protein COA49_06025 [Bacteroidota bacterium]
MNPMQIVTTSFKKFVSVALLFVIAIGGVLAQTDGMLLVSGTIKDEDSGRKLPGSVIVVFQDGEEYDRMEGDNSAGYSFELPLRHSYTFQYIRDGFVSKKVVLDVSNIPENDYIDGFGFDLDMTLFKTIEGFDESILDTPIGMGTYNIDTGKFKFDMDHTDRVKLRIENEKNRLNSIDENRSLNKRAFDVAMKAGENAMKKKQWQEALAKFEEALVLIPDTEEAIVERDKARAELDAISDDLAAKQAEEDAALAAEAAAKAEEEAARLAQEEEARQRQADADARRKQAESDAAAASQAETDAASQAEADAAQALAVAADKAAAEAANAAAQAATDAAAQAQADAASQAAAEAANAAANAESEAAARKQADELARKNRLNDAAAKAESDAAKKRAAEEAERKRAALLASSVTNGPDEAQKYYRDALKSENQARAQDLADRVKAEQEMLHRREQEARNRKDIEHEELEQLLERSKLSEEESNKKTQENIDRREEAFSRYRNYDNSVEKEVKEMYKGGSANHSIEIQTAQNLLDRQKTIFSGELSQRRIDSESGSYSKRTDLYEMKKGTSATYDGTPELLDADVDLPQGFYESSYKIQNGIVIERTLRDGDRVVHYRKVVMKTGTYYFRDGQSITSSVWFRETTVVHD